MRPTRPTWGVAELLASLNKRTHMFALGIAARVRGGGRHGTVKLAEGDKASQTARPVASGASVAKAVATVVTKGWEEQVLPKVKERLLHACANLPS